MSFFTRVWNAIHLFEGAKQTVKGRETRNANSHFEYVVGIDRDYLRNKARQEVANNPIVTSILNAVLSNCIGSGVTLQVKTGDSNLDKEIEKQFEIWTAPKNCDITGRFSFYELQKLVLKSKIIDGEILAIKVVDNKKKIPLQLQLLEADYFDTLKTNIYGENPNFYGVELDQYNRPSKYHLFKNLTTLQSSVLNAEQVIHYYSAIRPSQYRGVSDLAPIINFLKDYKYYQETELKSARVAASVAMAVKTKDTRGGILARTDKDDNDPTKRLTYIDGIEVHYLGADEEITRLDPNRVGTSYEPFVMTLLRLIAAGMGLSYEIVSKDYSKVNYSSARAGRIEDYKFFDQIQEHFATHFLMPVLEAFLETAYLKGTIKIPDFYQKKEEILAKCSWIFPARQFIDPVKEIKATAMEVALKSTTLEKIAKQKGEDWEDVMNQCAKEVELANKLGLNINTGVQQNAA